MTDTIMPPIGQNELTEEEKKAKRLKELQDSLSKLAEDSPDRKAIEDEIKELNGINEENSEEQEEKLENEEETSLKDQEKLPEKTEVQTRANSKADENSKTDKKDSDIDPDEEARLKAENERRLREFREKTIKESENIEITKDDVENFVDWCLGDNKLLWCDEGKGDENTNRMANQLAGAIFTRLSGTGIGMALISTGVLSWLGIIIIAWANTPNCVMSKLKETLADNTLGIIPADKIPNITDKLADLAEETPARVQAEVDRIKRLAEKRKEILSSQPSKEEQKNAVADSKGKLADQQLPTDNKEEKSSVEQDAESLKTEQPSAVEEKSEENKDTKTADSKNAPEESDTPDKQEIPDTDSKGNGFADKIPSQSSIKKHLYPKDNTAKSNDIELTK